ncbi:MAG: hypothetical protein LBR36_07200 [Bacteroidales bacterium]|nr:hypothetical protein [Bacteroidales bacterium]
MGIRQGNGDNILHHRVGDWSAILRNSQNLGEYHFFFSIDWLHDLFICWW